jgi:trigger factor
MGYEIKDVRPSGYVTIEGSYNFEELKPFYEHAYEEIKDSVEQKGFRKGKVPFEYFVSKPKAYLYLASDVINHILSNVINEVEKKLTAIFITNEEEDITFDKNLPFAIDTTVPFEFKIYKQLVKLPDEVVYNDLEIDFKQRFESEKDLNDYIGAELKLEPIYQPKESESIEGDEVVFKYDGTIEGLTYPGLSDDHTHLILGSHKMLPEFENGLYGLKKGDQKDINMTFPKDYGPEHIAGKDVIFKIEVLAVNERLPFVFTEKDIEKTKYKSLTEAIDTLKKQYQEDLEDYNKSNLLEAIGQKILKDTPFDIFEDNLEKFTKARFEDNYNRLQPRYKSDQRALEQISQEVQGETIKVKFIAVLSKIAEKENIVYDKFIENPESDAFNVFDELYKKVFLDFIYPKYSTKYIK